MDKKKKYLRFRHTFNHWLDVLESIKIDVQEILKEGEIDLTDYEFGNRPYHFYDIGEDLYPREAFLDENEIIRISTSHDPDGNGSFLLGWEDMIQDVTTFNDFMDCIFDNKDLRYDNEAEEEIDGELKLIERAAVLLDEISDMCADQSEHQDIVNFLSNCAAEARKWKQVKRLANETPIEWDDAVCKINPTFFTK